ncbi:hypothetical protein CAP35_11655 [Chitinophagaceae bacterium IBVUCB1]|nr:hypothetical protein CAP35_11655 [Chitinophagaceae bacterium IBVUCB1]
MCSRCFIIWDSLLYYFCEKAAMLLLLFYLSLHMPANKQCAKCNATFECKNDATDCWCQQYTLSSDALSYLKANYEDCLCSQCLRSYANQANPIISQIPVQQ